MRSTMVESGLPALTPFTFRAVSTVGFGAVCANYTLGLTAVWSDGWGLVTYMAPGSVLARDALPGLRRHEHRGFRWTPRASLI